LRKFENYLKILFYRMSSNNPPEDSIVRTIIEKFKSRSALGWTKYGTTLDREDLSTYDWIQHAQEELMDAILYLEKLKTYVVASNALPATSSGSSATSSTTAPSSAHAPVGSAPVGSAPLSPS